ncbi:MAG: hypothetical protein J1F40_04240 [Prevotellaceae bacterium]|nr:hypothetical protein [Prevotellaceae bacterium]
MKRFAFIMAGLLLFSAANAQDKEALKAQKDAQKAAESALKKAKQTYELSIPNPQYGRKETDFNKLENSLPLIQEAMKSEYTKDNPQTWKTAADIELEYYKKLENETKADPDNEDLKQKYIETSSNLVNYCIKYDSLLILNPKAKPDEVKTQHTMYQQYAVNPAIQLLQASQNYSNSDKQEDLKLGAKYSEEFLNAVEKSHLMNDFKNENLNDWKTYAKAFRAQSYLNIEGTPEDKIVSVYTDLMSTKYKGVAYQSLSNYYREKDPAKQNQYLQEGIDALKDDPEQKDLRANFAIILMQNQFQKGDKEGFKKTAALIKEEFSDNDNAINAYLMEGQMTFEDKQYDEAKAIFLTAKEKFPDEPKTLLMAARSAWMKAQAGGSKKEDMDEAIRLFKQLESENPEDPELWGESLYILYNNTQQPTLAAPYKKYYKAN